MRFVRPFLPAVMYFFCAGISGGALITNLRELTAADAASSDEFGSAVAIDGTTVVVGAPLKDGTSANFGAAYLINASTGAQLHKLVATDGAGFDGLGSAVDILGNTVIVGAPTKNGTFSFQGAAYLFDATTGAQVRKLTAADPSSFAQFGISLGLSGSRAVVGANASGAGAAYVFTLATGVQERKLTSLDGSSGDQFGASLDISGNIAVIGAPGDNGIGSAYLFDITTGVQLQKLTPLDGAANDDFGIDVSIWGNYAIVGARGNDDDGNGSGSAYIFSVSTGAQLLKLTASDAATSDNFGFSVDLDGQYAYIGAVGDASNAGSVYRFDYTTGAELDKFTASDAAAGDVLGWSVAASNNLLVAGAKRSDGVGFGSDSGSAYVFSTPIPEPGTVLFGVAVSTVCMARRVRRRTTR